MKEVASIDDIESIKDVNKLNLNQLKDPNIQKKVYYLLLKTPSWSGMIRDEYCIRNIYAYSNQKNFNNSPVIAIGGKKKIEYKLTFMLNDKKDIFFYREKNSKLELCKIGTNGGRTNVFDSTKSGFIPKGRKYLLLSPATAQRRTYGLVKKINVSPNLLKITIN